ncbi:1-acylglycerol-3-phosphate O-acyltransferase [Chytriomyces confervae]|uniref:1-acyl-sn-glycerol-3-phosphate acyltransferase n=1 Tax=Chytriomyces confervae TaxID=246404 RepID=A0A507E5G3_9FUNG|nr:1-acylglycerol-3-phosphate O-acyltransferase [Chytriomyces hyalinus]TPX59313.1 1-acylglycerol-3-phosphate O-acyltransferase [Chytriomyces confervae]
MKTVTLFTGLLLFAFLYATTKQTRFVVRFALMILLIAPACTYAMIAYIVLALFGAPGSTKDVNKQLGFAYSHLVDWFLPIKVELVEGSVPFDDRRPCVFICNHQSEVDFIAMATVFPKDAVILAKKSIRYIPFMGWYMALAGNVFIDRRNRESAVETMGRVAKIIQEKKVGVFMFPEGTRSRQTTNELLPFKKGAFNLAVQGQIPIVPMVVSSYHGVCNIKNMIFDGGVIRVKILKAIETEGCTNDDVDRLTQTAQDLMSKTLVEISGPVPAWSEPLKIKKAKKE